MKVSTDGVLLGAWCRLDLGQDKVILDIGTGTGLIALQLAQRMEGYAVEVEAVEIDPAFCDVAERNFEKSKWVDRLTLHKMSAQEFAQTASAAQKKYGHIVSNPPYFMDSLSSPDEARNLARLTASLSYEDLISVCDKLLMPAGRVSLVIPAGVETRRMIAAAGAQGFAVSRRMEVHSTPKSGPKRTLLEFSRIAATNVVAEATENAPNPTPTTGGNTIETALLVIQDGGPGVFSAEYRALTRDFYLYF